ncbi:MAG: hypothetical protein EPN43_05860 [Jatrophihabitans sp.]|nr:MAG: hypothetical protein EPN43_05860 [Jatrophihabitans sp.]
MNDLAEHALRALDAGRRKLIAHPLPALAGAGFACAALVVVTGGRIGASPSTVPLDGWLGLQPTERPGSTALLGSLMFGGIVALLLLWVVTVLLLHRRTYPPRTPWALAAVWGAPLALGPPVLSPDIYLNAGRGLLAARGFDPYRVGVNALGNIPLLNAVDPAWRSAPSTAGPLGTLLQHAVAFLGGDNAIGTVIGLRLIGVGAVIGIGLLAAELAGPLRSTGLGLTVLNPALLLLVVNGAHLDGVLGVLLLGALLASSQRRRVLAVVLVCAAAALKPVALVAVLAVLIAHATGRRDRVSWQIAARDGALAAVCLVGFTFAVPDGLGWVRNLPTVVREHLPFAPSSVLSEVIGPMVPSASFDDLQAGGRVTVVLAAVVIIAWLLATTRHRTLDRTVGYALLTAAVLAPVVYPWYLLWAVCCLAPAAVGIRRDWVVALSAVACVLTPSGFATATAEHVTLAALLLVGLALLPTLVTHSARRRRVSGV